MSCSRSRTCIRPRISCTSEYSVLTVKSSRTPCGKELQYRRKDSIADLFHVRLFVSVGAGTENNDISWERVFESDARDDSGLTHMGAWSMWEVLEELSLTAYLSRY
eukprot:7734822-Pyramimonas_sp.AAC.1